MTFLQYACIYIKKEKVLMTYPVRTLSRYEYIQVIEESM
jgi:hypothetical protein